MERVYINMLLDKPPPIPEKTRNVRKTLERIQVTKEPRQRAPSPPPSEKKQVQRRNSTVMKTDHVDSKPNQKKIR